MDNLLSLSFSIIVQTSRVNAGCILHRDRDDFGALIQIFVSRNP